MRIIFGILVIFGMLTGSAVAETIKIGHMPVINQSDIVSEELGMYKKYGLDVELKLFQTGPAALQGLLSGDLEVVEAGGVPMLNLAAQNLPLYFLVSGGINSPKNPVGEKNDYDAARYAGVLELVKEKAGWGKEEPGGRDHDPSG